MVLHKQFNFEVLSWEIFNVPEIYMSGASSISVNSC